MRRLNELFFWEIKPRIKVILEYRDLVTDYFNKVGYSDYSGDYYETEASRPVRSLINIKSSRVHEYVEMATSPVITHYPAPAVGGFVTQVDLLNNIFNIYRYQIPIEDVVDVLERAVGVYQKEFRSSIVRSLNPFSWLGRILEIFASIPFQLLGSLGFNKDKIERSPLGKLIKFLFKFMTVLLSFWEALYRLGLFSDRINAKAFFSGWLGIPL